MMNSKLLVTYLCLHITLLSAQLDDMNIIKSRDMIYDNSIDSNSSNFITYHRENKKPIFTQCEEYKPEVKEEQVRGTFVIQVHADDEDNKNEKGGRVTYSIVRKEDTNTVNFFTINSTTGEIYTNVQFDRDEPARQKELYLTVQATDDGRPPLADICTFKVTVTDINDNSPSFDRGEHRTHVSEDTKVNSIVMRIVAYDIDEGDNSKLTYSFGNESNEFNQYFKIDNETGVVYLKKDLKYKAGTEFLSIIHIHDNGIPQNSITGEVSIIIVSSEKQAPSISADNTTISVKEDWNDFEKPLVIVHAKSNINDPDVVFELVRGQTEQTNKEFTFILNELGNNSAMINIGHRLDYERVTEYRLTVVVKNKDQLAASIVITVKVEDVNDNIPLFMDLLKGSVVENDVIGAQAMQVRAIDKDGTSPNNRVTYELLSPTDLFKINNETGVITALSTFDREVEKLYHVLVRASDGAPSAILRDKTKPNSVNQTFQISIEDRNDNPPKFTKSIYIVHNISESSDVLKDVIEVIAEDKDDASLITYSIIEGNIGDAFTIEQTTGRIRVKNKLDYEKIESYNLTVRAYDGIYDDTAKVIIYVQNENDEPPVFEKYNKSIYVKEEEISNGCIITLKAYDPDIKDRNANQRIVYSVAQQHKSFLSITQDGCVSLITPLDRDLPNGAPQYQGYIYANDNDGGTNSLSMSAELNIILIDINDNAPKLNISQVVWYENEPQGKIVTLTAYDFDSLENGPPFKFDLASNTDVEIYEKFSIQNGDLWANVIFDREEKKFYDIPIEITDSGKPPQSDISILRVIIGDRNDNMAYDGSSEIFVYKYEGLNKDIKIGRIYVEDLDDWDLPDKIFQPKGELNENFDLSLDDKGMIIMKRGAVAGVYDLQFLVTEEHLPDIPRHTVNANVTVTIKAIPEEAVRKSGSIRLRGTTSEKFIEKESEFSPSKKDVLQKYLANILNISIANVDVFTVLPTPSNNSLVDVRFSAHGSPYYAPERLNNKATEEQDELERALGVEFLMIGISECLDPRSCSNKSSCTNVLQINDEPAAVFTNKTSFVGVQAIVEAVCDCLHRVVNECFNGGLPIDGGCSCPEGFEGPNCEILGIGFDGNGWAMYQTFDSCNNTDISLSILPQQDNGLIFYVGPLTLRQAIISKDFMSLEMKDGLLLLKMDLGYGPIEISWNKKKLNDGSMHKIKILIAANDVQIEVDECGSDCLTWKNFQSGLLNVNGPLQVGGRRKIFSEQDTKYLWQTNYPTNKGFSGCITNFTYNSYVYNLGSPSDSESAHINCHYGLMQAVSFGIDSNFLVAILVCIAILLILLLAVVVHKRKQDNFNEKDIDDTRENIINYEDEGGGECDTNFDLSVFRPNLDEKPPIREQFYKQGTDVPADINVFLDNKKLACDKDPDNLPYDDVRHYGYEGDGNTSGSLSSLASCTDEGDLKFNYLSSFGPRFRKLADMYGDDGSEEGSQNGGEESWC